MIEFLIWFVSSLISALGVIFLYYKISSLKKCLNLLIILIILLGSFILSVSRYYDIMFLSSISYFLFYPLVFYLLKKQTVKSLVFFTLIIFIYGMILDSLSMLIISFILFVFNWHISISNLSLIMTFIVFIFMISLAHSKCVKKFTNEFFNAFQKINYPDFILVIFTIFVLLIGIVMFINLDKLSINFVLSILIFLIIFNFTFLIKYKLNSFETARFVEVLRKNNQFYISVDDENRIFKHNIVAKLLSIKSVSNHKARLLIDDLLNNFISNIDFNTHIENIPYGLNGILYQKIYPFLNNLEIKINNEIYYDIFEVLNPRRYNVLVEKIVISLDNAIEASLKSVDRILIINLYEENNYIVIEIQNSLVDSIDVDFLGSINYSTKKRNSGLGLFSAMRDKEVSMDIKIINDMFVSHLEAKKNK